MATQGLLTLPAGIAILFGAKIGTGITAILAGSASPRMPSARP
jgi:phosphate:Na+ symporter